MMDGDKEEEGIPVDPPRGEMRELQANLLARQLLEHGYIDHQAPVEYFSALLNYVNANPLAAAQMLAQQQQQQQQQQQILAAQVLAQQQQQQAAIIAAMSPSHAPIASGFPFLLSANLPSAVDQTANTAIAPFLITPPTTGDIPQCLHLQHYHQAVQNALSSQMTIPQYIPPTCATWGEPQVTVLSVQDRQLVPPIYNGINPNYPNARLLHAHPPIFVVDDFLSHAECDFLIEAAADSFMPAPVVGRGSGEVSPSRTSSTCYLAREDLPEYLRKISLLTGKPPEHCELPQVGRFRPGEQYLQHFDAFDLSDEDGRRFAANGGQRTVTVLVYLNDVAQGGATSFPHLNVEVQPRRGMAVIFFPSTLDGLLDRMALHSAMPAVDVKYVSQVWIRQSNYEGRPSKRLPCPMVAGLQEMRDAALEVQQREMIQHHFAQQQQQSSYHHTVQMSIPPVEVQQDIYQKMEG